MNWHHLASKAHALKQCYAPGMTLPSLVYITDYNASDPFWVIPKLPFPTLVVIRDYNHPERSSYIKKLATICRAVQQPFLIAGAASLAIPPYARGIHLPQHQAQEATSLRQMHPTWWITSSAHTQEEIEYTNTLPLDALFISPIFSTASHPTAPALGIKKFKTLIPHSKHPVYALGGITADNCSLLDSSGAYGIASIRAFRSA